MSQTNQSTAPEKSYLAAVPPSEKPIYIALLISALFGLITVLIPLCPVSVEMSDNRTVLMNMIGAVNQTVGADATRSETFVPLLLYFVAASLLAAGCVNMLHHLKSSALFFTAASVTLLVFVSVWKNADLPQTDAAVRVFTQSAFPYAVIFCAVGALIAALAAMLLGTEEFKKLRRS